MDHPYLLSEAQMRRIRHIFPLSHGIPRVDDRLIVSAIRGHPPHQSNRNSSPIGGVRPQRKADVHHHHQADHLGRGIEISEPAGRLFGSGHALP